MHIVMLPTYYINFSYNIFLKSSGLIYNTKKKLFFYELIYSSKFFIKIYIINLNLNHSIKIFNFYMYL